MTFFFTTGPLPIIGLIAITLLLFARALYFRKKFKTSNKECQMLRAQLLKTTEELQELQQRNTANCHFQKDLQEAAITTRLQAPRLAIHHGHGQTRAPERYQYVRAMVDNGMEAAEIAAILRISPHEAEQLVNLSRLSTASQ